LTNARNDAEDARQLLRDHRDPIDEKRATRDRARKADAEKKVEAERERTTLARVAREYHERVIERKSTPLQPASGFRVSSVTSRRRSGPSAFGFQALAANNGYYNTASGFAALVSNTTGAGNTATGMQGLYSNTSGVYNTATGIDTLYYNTLGYYNTASGAFALVSNTTGGNNIAVGYQAGYNLATGSNNIDIGNPGGSSAESATIRIGSLGAHTAAYIAGIDGAAVTGSAVFVTSSGQLGVLASSERYKTNVTAMGLSTGKLDQLRPVTFKLKTDPQGTVQYGLIAEEVNEVYPAQVIRDAEGKIDGVRYEELALMTLNEVQQLHQKLVAQAQQLQDVQQQLAEV